MNLTSVFQAAGAQLANDGIPLHFGDLAAEYRAALDAAVLMDRSHEGRLVMTGRDRLAIAHRISTNDLERLRAGEGAPTIFTNAVGRIIDRAAVYHRHDEGRGDEALFVTEPGRGEPLRAYLQSNLFFNDEARIANISAETRQLALHGVQADAVANALAPDLALLPAYGHRTVTLAGAAVFVGRRLALSGAAWTMMMPNEAAAAVWQAVIDAGRPYGLRPAGSLTYNLLRIRAGRPGVGHELSGDYIPLEVGLWDEVSFSKGCYTGQEIIARMESRGRLARTIARLRLSASTDAPCALLRDGREVGTLTSSVSTPDGEHIGIGVVKVAVAQVGMTLAAGAGANAEITALPGAQPPPSA